jgi:hypothetical protein
MERRRLLLALSLGLAAGLPASARAREREDKEKKKGGGSSYIQINAISATITRLNGRRGVLTVETGVDVPNEKLRERVNLVLPRLRAAYVQTLQIYAGGLTPGTAPDADFLSRELQKETDRVLGQRGARLLLGAMLMN